jgi:hypothetical protein
MEAIMGLNLVRLFLVIPLAVSACAARAEDKSGFTLFNPTPRPQMRELNTDRPDTTESPYTVDAGHFQIELSFVDFTHDKSGGVSTDTVVAAPFNLKAGLLNNVDIQFVLDPYVNQRTGSARSSGLGDALVRLKINLLGNDDGKVAFGVMPFIKFPTATHDLGNDHFEGGIIFPLALQLPAEFDLGTMLEIDFIRDADNSGYGTALLHTVTLGHKLWGELSGYVEYAGTSFINAGSTYQAVIGTGVTYQLNDDMQLDAGANFGISESADDYNLFVGLSIRI